MSRTYRRKNQKHDYSWVLIHWGSRGDIDLPPHDPQSVLGRRAIARYHSDRQMTMRSTAPRWYRKIFDRQLRNRNNRQMRKWLANQAYDPIFEVSHRHDANYGWW